MPAANVAASNLATPLFGHLGRIDACDRRHHHARVPFGAGGFDRACTGGGARRADGRQRPLRRWRLTSFEDDLAILKQNTVEEQEPFAAVLSCADSRVPVELVFDQSIGHVFVARVAGNICTPEIIASLEYGGRRARSAAIMVLGHAGAAP